MNIVAAKAQAFVEASEPEFADYAHSVIENAKAMCEVFCDRGFQVLTGGTDSHIILLDLSNHKLSGREAADLLEQHDITVNKNGVPGDPRSFVETSGIRLGTAAETTLGHKKQWFEKLAHRICGILNGEEIRYEK